MDIRDPVDDDGLLDMDCEGDSLLQTVDCQPDATLGDAFSTAGVSPHKYGARLKEKGLNLVSGENSVCQSKCLSPNGDNKENLPMATDDTVGSSLVTEDPQQEKRRKKAKGFNLRKSLAWNRAFFTEEGVLDSSELPIFNCSFGHATNGKLPTVNEVEDTSLGGDSLGSSDLRSIKEEISSGSHKKKPQVQARKPIVSSPIKSTSQKMKSAPALNKMSTKGRADLVGACSQPPNSNSQRSQILGKTVRSTSGTQKRKAAKPSLTMSSTNPTLEGKHLKSVDKDTVQKYFATKGRAGTNIKAAPGLSTRHLGKSSTRNFPMKANDSEEKSKKLRGRQELDISKTSSGVKNVDNNIDENASQLSSASSPRSSVDTTAGSNIHNRQAGGTSAPYFSGSSHTGRTRKATLDAENTMQNPALQNSKSELSAVSGPSNLGLPVYQDTKCTGGNLLPAHHPKPSALKMPSPTLGFFGQAKAFGAHVQTHKSAPVAGPSTHGSSLVKATCLPQLGNLNSRCLPPSTKLPRPTSATVGAVTSQPRQYCSYKNSTGADLPSAVCLKLRPTLEENVPGELKLEAPFGPDKQRNNENNGKVLTGTNPEAGNVLSEEKHGNDKAVDETMLNEKCQHSNQKVVDIDQNVKPVATRSPNEEEHRDDENNYKGILIGDSKRERSGKLLHFSNTGNDRNHDNMDFPCSRLSEMPSTGHEVLTESMPVQICDTQRGCEDNTGKPLASNQGMASDLSVPDVVAGLLSPKEPHEICNPVIDKKRHDTEEAPFNGSIAVDSEKKKLRRSSDSTFDVCLEPTSNEVVDMVTDPSVKSLCSTGAGEDDQERMTRFVSIEDKFSLKEIEVDMIQENGSYSGQESTKGLLVCLPSKSQTLEEQTVRGSGNLDNSMNDEVQQIVRVFDDSVDNGSIHYKYKIDSQQAPVLGCPSSSLSQDTEVATSDAVHAVHEEFANIDCHGSTNQWINSKKDVNLEEEMGDSQLNHLMVEPPSDMTGEIASCVEITQATDSECYKSGYGGDNTSEKAQEFPTSDEDAQVVGEAAQGDMENSISSAQGSIVSNNQMPLDCENQEPVSMKYPVDVVPFSDEWISAMEAAGEDVFKKKTGAVQNSPPDKVLPEPGPWSPHRSLFIRTSVYQKVIRGCSTGGE